MTQRNSWLMACALLSCSVQASHALQTRPHRDITVLVVDYATNRSIQGARVAVLSEAWKELAFGTTDEVGDARLSVPVDGERPKYVIAEHPAFYLSGRGWTDKNPSYYLRTTILVVR